MPQSIAIAWFRQDLRIADNPALTAAAEYDSVLPIYILDDINAADWAMGAASRVWLHHSLANLSEALDGKLQLFVGDAGEIIRRLVDTLDIDAVFWNRCYEPWRLQRDKAIKKDLNSRAITARSFNGSLLWEPWTVSKKDGTPYRVFTPFYKNGCLGSESPRAPLPRPSKMGVYRDAVDFSRDLEELSLLPTKPAWHKPLLQHWRIGESAAHEQVQQFCDSRLDDYKRGRDFPGLEATSRLSPHLHFGEISPHSLWHLIEHETMHRSSNDAPHFLREIGWREFSYYLLYHFPQLPERNFNARFDEFEWLDDDDGLKQWQRGETGFPIVDAGMRELWQTGYMHNRVRMIVASFLIKNMLTHWRHGASWFWDCLVDADLASNSASWQWCAGSGADAAPYFRIFNPVLQSEKFDPDGDYLLHYCPELKGLPARLRHQPWLASEAQLKDAGLRLGIDYPRPILDLKATRERALQRYKALP